MLTLAEVDVPMNVLKFLAAIIRDNRIIVDDEVASQPLFTQTACLARRSDLSPLLLPILLNGFPDQIRKPRKLVETILYVVI